VKQVWKHWHVPSTSRQDYIVKTFRFIFTFVNRNAVQSWWSARIRSLDVAVNELRLAGFQRFGRASFQRRS
jgi:hypothetical protein